MISWKAVYARCRDDRQFVAYFTRQGKIPRESDFDLRVFVMPFFDVPGSATAGVPGTLQGPLPQTFDSGAVVIGITCGCFVPQQAFAAADYGPSALSAGKRDLLTLYLARTDDEDVTSTQKQLSPTAFLDNQQARVIAESLCSGGEEDIFPQEILIAPGQALSVAVASLLATATHPTISVHVAFHAMVPRGE